MSGSVICHKCNGNGYLGDTKNERKQQDCITCKNSGEIPLTYEMIWSTLQFVTRKQ
jgi:DnaJ-class molecular chaperone